jgi:DNA-binding PadR family transcriptional regulator
VSFGSLYPALARLERAGAVAAVESDRRERAIPQTGSLGGELAAFRAGTASRGRSRKVYGITAGGEALFEELLAGDSGPGDDTRTFNLRLAFARYLPADARIGMLERRRAHLLERLRRSRSRGRPGRGRIDGYLHSLLEHDRETAEHDLSWIDRLIARERSAREGRAERRAPATRGPAPPGGAARASGELPGADGAPADPTGSPPPSLSGLGADRRHLGTGQVAPAGDRPRRGVGDPSAPELSAHGADKERR